MRFSVEEVDRQDHLRQVGADRPVGDLHADRIARRSRGVLQMGDVIGVEVYGNQALAGRIRDIVDGDDVWPGMRAPIPFSAASTAADAADVVRTTLGRESCSATARRSA